MKGLIFYSLVILSVFGCKAQQKDRDNAINNASSKTMQPFVAALPHVVIYKTTNDYNYNVPVMLSDNKIEIISYPHPTDLFYNGELALPTILQNGYLLDNRGIGKNVAFLKYTYDEYSKLSEVPTLDELQKNIIDKEPLTELWDCGIRNSFTDLQKQLNEWIDKNMLVEKCKRIK